MPSFVAVRRRTRSLWLGCVVAILVAACGTATGPSASATAGMADASAMPATAGPPEPSGAAASPAAVPSPGDLGDRLVATIDGVSRPCALAATDEAVWVTANQPSMLARIDPTDNRIVKQFALDGAACGIAISDDGRIWVALLSAGTVVAVDPATGAVAAAVEGLGAQLWDLKAGFGSIWVVDRSNRMLVRIDPAKAEVIATIPIGRSASGLAVVDGAAWVVDEADSSVRRIDPASNTISATVPVTLGAAWFADDGRVLLVADQRHGTVTAIDTTALTAGPPTSGLRQPLDGTVIGTRAYVPDGRGHDLAEIDIVSGATVAVDRLERAIQPFVAEAAFGDVWVLDFGGERIWRIRP